MILTALLALAAAVQAPTVPPPAPGVDRSDYHFRYLNRLEPREGWKRTISGIRYRRMGRATNGAHPAPTDTVTIHYAGRFTDGVEFDSSVARGQPATFPLPRLIRGWQEGVPLMRVGERFEFAIPYTMAYGPNGRGPIPGGATLVFAIELIAIAPPAPPPAP
jgi:FKBP-type peptidyl-prolyl cis-trans isomerase FkpA